MAAAVLNSPQAVAMSVYVVRAFVKLRQILSDHRELAYKLALLERKIGKHDDEIKAIFSVIKQLMQPPIVHEKKKKIGFNREKE
jgi:arsenate reductase-like glutaredoxin family protein